MIVNSRSNDQSSVTVDDIGRAVHTLFPANTASTKSLFPLLVQDYQELSKFGNSQAL